MKSRYDPETEMNQIGATLKALRPARIVDIKDLLLALEKWEDEIRKHEEITGAATLNKATTKAIVTEMASPELATHLKLQPELAEHPEETYRVSSIG